MKKLKNALLILGIVALIGASMYVGWSVAKPEKTQRLVTAEVILTTLHAQGFLISEKYVFDEPITIENTQGTWKDLFFGQTIEARGVVEVSMGIDLQKVKEEDVDFQLNKVILYLPQTEIYNTRLVGRIDVQNKQGILKRLLDSDDGYNQALEELTVQAEAAAKQENLQKIADENAVAEITRILKLVVKDKEIEVRFKNNEKNEGI
ncbi:MAG TPA: DUF4230 domain-containing protein [Candidatus Bipolaricaulota bacterium]|nr:DUF4230 domain-containing protein [Candidatus Bipolaricaulota bacterium]